MKAFGKSEKLHSDLLTTSAVLLRLQPSCYGLPAAGRSFQFQCRITVTTAARLIAMPSFDIVSELNAHEVANAIDQANREVGTRFDFKGTDAKYELKDFVVTMTAQADFQLKQMLDILKLRLAKRGVDIVCMKTDEPVIVGQTAKQTVTLRQGIDTELGKKIQRLINDSKLKVQAAIQDKQVRVSGKSRDDLRSAIALVRGAKLELPMQYINFRD